MTHSNLQKYAGLIPRGTRDYLKAVGDDIRIALVMFLIAQGETTFSEIVGKTRVRKSTLAHHLAMLVRAGLVENYYKKTNTKTDYSYYRVTTAAVNLIEAIKKTFGAVSVLQQITGGESRLWTRGAVESAIRERRGLRGADLSRLDLANMNLSGVDLSHARLLETNFTGSDLSNVHLNSANLLSATLCNCVLTDAQLVDTILVYAVLDHSRLDSANLTRAKLQSARMQHTNLDMATFAEGQLQHSDLSGAEGKSVNFRGSNLMSACLSMVKLESADFTDAKLNAVSFRDAALTQCVFENCDFSGADLLNARHPQSHFNCANLGLAGNLSELEGRLKRGDFDPSELGNVILPQSLRALIRSTDARRS